MPQRLIQEIEHVFHRFGVIAVPQKSQHHFAVDEMNSQKDFSTLPANDGVQLNDWGVRVFIHKALKAAIISSNPAGTIHLES